MTIEKLKAEYEEFGDYEDLESFVVVKEGKWVQDGKYQQSTSIVQSKETQKYYAVHQFRSGSYYSDYEYGETEFNEVERAEKVKVVVYWKAI